MVLYIVIAVVLLMNIINPRNLWYIASWKDRDAGKEEPLSLYLFLCRTFSALGLLLLVLVIYFKPVNLADLGEVNSEIRITQQHVYVENGEPYIDSESYNDLSEEQTRSILDSLRRYKYRRTLGTLFSDGSLSDLGEKMICIYIYKEKELVYTVMITDTGNISVNSKIYVMQNSSELIQEIYKIMKNGMGKYN